MWFQEHLWLLYELLYLQLVYILYHQMELPIHKYVQYYHQRKDEIKRNKDQYTTQQSQQACYHYLSYYMVEVSEFFVDIPPYRPLGLSMHGYQMLAVYIRWSW